MAINHFGHALLTSHLFPLLKSTAEKGDTVRITNTASNMHQSTPSSTRFESLDEINQDLGASALYGRSKLANILFARWFNRNITQQGHPNIIMNATHPGFVSSRMSKEQIHEP
jgi:NAD(P)-dependent dehydrogenase (short-subunit alcohol dehydrogenase family)